MQPVRVVVDSRLRIARAAHVTELVLDRLREEFTHSNPDYDKWSSTPHRIRKWKPEPPRTIETWRDEPDGTLSLPRGGTGRLREILSEHGMVPAFEDRRSSGTIASWSDPRIKHRLVLFDYQEEMVEAALKYQNCILRAPCGGGKSSVGIAIAARVGVSTLIVVPSARIFDEWVKRLGSELGLVADEIGWFGRGKRRIRPITVATVDTVRRRAIEVAALFGCVIFDEVQRAPATTVYPAIDSLPCRYRIGVSADERRKDRKHGINYDLFGRVVVNVPKEKLIRDKRVLPVDVRMVPTDFRADWYVSLENEDKRRADLYTRLIEEMMADETRTSLAVVLAAGEMALRPTLVFSHRVEHCAKIRADLLNARPPFSLLRIGVILGDKDYAEESDETVAGLQDGTYRCGVGTYQSIGTGIDLPSVESGVAVTPILANRQNFGQIRDRLCRVDRRPGATKQSATLYVLWDRAVFGDRPVRNAVSWNAGRVRILEGEAWVDGREYLRDRSEYSLI